MIIKSATFIKSAVKPGQYPDTDLPEIAFAGRSNVGKSSLINTLLSRRNLVKTSATPGKTRLINFFAINDAFVFVDLPGYGYAKVSKQERAQWGPMVESYLARRNNLRGMVLLQDIRRSPGKEEGELMTFLEHLGLPYLFILTKADKLSGNKRSVRIKQLREIIHPGEDGLITFSSKTGEGKESIWKGIIWMMGGSNE